MALRDTTSAVGHVRGVDRVGEGETRRPASRLDRAAVWAVQTGLKEAPVRVVLWDGSSCYRLDTPPVAEVRVVDRRTLWSILRNRDVGFGEGFRNGRIAVEGDLTGGLEAIFRVGKTHRRRLRRVRYERPWKWPNTLRRAWTNVHRHYDIGNDFYRLWLDSERVYTCAYYESPDMSLEDAQRAKMDLVCRKLRLQEGERVVEAGSGWGALALHMARHYGVSVRAFNVSREQVEYARHQARAASLTDRVEFVEDDYRNISGQYDVFVSVGMLEHVGQARYATFGDIIDRSLPRDHGRGLVHFIGRSQPHPFDAWMSKRVFPGAHAPTVAEVAAAVFEPHDLAMTDIENLRRHYARTCEEWLARYEASEEQVTRMLGPEQYRTWRLYLAGSTAAFRTGWLQLFQIVFTRAGDNDQPWTRADLYRRVPAAG